MLRHDDINILPEGLPVPQDDGACDHLTGLRLPSIVLPASDGQSVDLSALRGRSVVYIYPKTGLPNKEPPRGWNEIPGARGCTPQSCSFRDHQAELDALGVRIFGLSTQDSEYQLEAVTRLHLPFPLLSDANLAFAHALNLPTFIVADMELIKRITLVINNGKIEKVFYPVFPPDQNVFAVIEWLNVKQQN